MNNYRRSGKKGFIDNWELYETNGTGIFSPSESAFSSYVQNQSVVTNFDLNHSGLVNFEVFNLQGVKVYSESFNGNTGMNHRIFETQLKSGVYMIRILSSGQQLHAKIVK